MIDDSGHDQDHALCDLGYAIETVEHGFGHEQHGIDHAFGQGGLGRTMTNIMGSISEEQDSDHALIAPPK